MVVVFFLLFCVVFSLLTWQNEKSAIFCHISKIVCVREIYWLKVNFLISMVGLSEGFFHPKEGTCARDKDLPHMTETKTGSHATSHLP